MHFKKGYLFLSDKGLCQTYSFFIRGVPLRNLINFREMTLGGYIQTITTFVPVDESFKPFPVLAFVATAQSKHWLGPACASSIAKQVKIVPIDRFKFLQGYIQVF